MTTETPAAAKEKGDSVASAQGRTATRWLAGVPAIVGFLLLWETTVRLEWIDPVLFPPPTDVFPAMWQLAESGRLWEHIVASAARAGYGFALAAAAGVGIGLVVGRSERIHRVVWPILDFFRQLPPLAIFPVFLLFFGLGIGSKIAIVFWAAVWPILLNTTVGVREVDETLIKAARALDVSRRLMFTGVVLPAALPTMFAGLRLGATYSVLVLVGAEMIGANSGIGFLILQSQYQFRFRDMYAAIIVLGIVGYLLNVILMRIERRIARWKRA